MQRGRHTQHKILLRTGNGQGIKITCTLGVCEILLKKRRPKAYLLI